jgi:DNA-binding CsgD family transcriptional regulator
MLSDATDLSFGDVRALLRLSGEVRELGGDPEAWRRHLLAELGRLCGGTLGVAFEHWTPRGVGLENIRREWSYMKCADGYPSPAERSLRNAHVVDRGFATERDRAFYYEHIYQGDTSDDPAWGEIFTRVRADNGPGDGLTYASDDLVDRRTWDTSPFVQERARACGLGHYVLSARFLYARGCIVGLQIARPWGEKPFTPREVALVELVHAELGHSLRRSQPAGVAELAPRYQRVLALLLEGQREKEVADALDLSPSTVHEYVKHLYRHFGVTRGFGGASS